MAQYQELPALANGAVMRDDGLCIPNDPRNRHWQEYQQWVADGGVPDPVPAAAKKE